MLFRRFQLTIVGTTSPTSITWMVIQFMIRLPLMQSYNNHNLIQHSKQCHRQPLLDRIHLNGHRHLRFPSTNSIFGITNQCLTLGGERPWTRHLSSSVAHQIQVLSEAVGFRFLIRAKWPPLMLSDFGFFSRGGNTQKLPFSFTLRIETCRHPHPIC